MQRPFDHTGDTFTLEKIIELGLDQFAEKISEISAAASKELAIENVSFTARHTFLHMCDDEDLSEVSFDLRISSHPYVSLRSAQAVIRLESER